MVAEPIGVTLAVIGALDALDVPYLIGGSLASALHGVIRATMDADLVADLGQEHIAPTGSSTGRCVLCRYADHSQCCPRTRLFQLDPPRGELSRKLGICDTSFLKN